MARWFPMVGVLLVILAGSAAASGEGLRRVVVSGELDPVSGEAFSRFGRAVINDSGDVAFEGFLEWETYVGANNDEGLWSTFGGLHRVARENHPMVGGVDWDTLTGMDLLNSGELIGTCRQYYPGSADDLRAVWTSRGGSAEVIADTNMDAGIPQGSFDGQNLGAGLVGCDGTYFFQARRKDSSGQPYTTFSEPFIATETFKRLYEGPQLPEGYELHGHTYSPLPARVLPGGVLEHTAVRTVWEEVQQFPDGPTLSQRRGVHISVWRTDQNGSTMHRELPLAAPGGIVGDLHFDDVEWVGMNDHGRVIADAWAAQADGSGAVRGVWAETPDGWELVHANTSSNLSMFGRVTGPDVVLSDNGVWAYPAEFSSDKCLLLDVGLGLKSSAIREGLSTRGLPSEVTVEQILSYAMSPTGQLVVLARFVEVTRASSA
ncbi:MAG: hypothetical protein ACLFV7_05465, partial [Phycisphaerae bacterium]